MTERQVIVTWYTPEEKLPPDGEIVVVTFSGKDKNFDSSMSQVAACVYG